MDLKDQLDIARKFYPTSGKPGIDKTLAILKKHKDWESAIPLLLPAMASEKRHKDHLKQSGQFCPQWKNLQTWLNQRCWEDEYTTPAPQRGDIDYLPSAAEIAELFGEQFRGGNQ